MVWWLAEKWGKGTGDQLNILQKIRGYAQNVPERTAVRCGAEALTYRELWEYSDVLAAWLKVQAGEEKQPLAVYGHKNPWMLVCFLACVKSGHGYCPKIGRAHV